MNKRIPTSEVSKPPVRMRLLHLSPQELKNVRISIRRKDVPHDSVSGPLVRSLGDPKDLQIHKPDEGRKPIFDRDDIVVNLDFEERIVITMPESPKRRSLSKSAERQTSGTRDRRSRSHSRQRSSVRKYNSRSRSRSTGRDGHYSGNTSKEHSRNRSKTSFERNTKEYENRLKIENYANKAGPSSSQKSNRRSSSKERRSFSRDREHSTRYRKSLPRSDHHRSSHYDSDRRFRRTPSPHKSDYRQRKRSKSPTYKRETAYSDHTHYRKSQERRSRSRYRDRETKYRDYRKRSRSPYSRDRYKSPDRKIRREYSRSPPKYIGPPEAPGRHNPHPYMPPHFGPPWPGYEPMAPYVRYIIPEGYVPVPPPRFTGSMNMRPRMPQRQLPVYNSRVIPKIKPSNTKPSTSNMNAAATVSSSAELSTVSKDISDNVPEISSKSENQSAIDTASTSRESIDTLLVVTTTQEIIRTE